MKKVIGVIVILLALMTPVEAKFLGFQFYVYRICNRETGEHLYTNDYSEVWHLICEEETWRQDDISFYALTESGDPVYRLYNPYLDDHLYTMDENEIKVLTNEGWVQDNAGNSVFHSIGPVPIYRLYNPNTGRHILTPDLNEYDYLGARGWEREGIKMYATQLDVLERVSDNGFYDGSKGDTAVYTDGNGNYSFGYNEFGYDDNVTAAQ